MPARPVAEWARAAPAARDAVLALAEQAVGLQPAAEAVIQWHRLDGEVAPGDAEEGRRVERTYQDLADRLRAMVLDPAVALDPVVAEPLAGLLGQHLELVRRAVGRSRPPEGLGPVAGELVGLRDLLRRTATVRGRLVADVPGL